MKFSIIFFVVFGALLAFASGNDCNIKGTSVQAGKTFDPIGECVHYTCHDDGSFSAVTCPAASYTSNCKETEVDLTKPYPDCCSKVVC